jgi:hypothetical protein
MSSLDQLIVASLNRPQRNIFGDLGPRCPPCSGLGQVLTIGERVTRSTSKCGCEGSGLDLQLIERADRESMWKAIHRIERQMGKAATKRFPSIKMSRQYWMECIAWATATGTPIATSTTETIVFPNVTIPANYMQDGRGLRVKLLGSYGTTATPTLIFSVRWGGVAGTVLAKQAANVTTSAVGGGASMTALWEMEFMIQTRSNGATGTLMTNGSSILYTSTLLTAGTVTNYGQPAPLVSGSTGGTTPVAVTADLTADTALSVTATWGTSNAANSIQGLQYTLESMN